MEEEPPPPRPKAEVARELKAWIEKNSEPRKYHEPQIDRGPRTPLSSMSETISRLSQPRSVYKKPRRLQYVNPNALTATASERINQLSEPRCKFKSPSKDSFLVSKKAKEKQALQYVASPRITDLAQCPPCRLRKIRNRVPGRVRRKALKASASPRVVSLAVPAAREVQKPNEFAFRVNPLALKYKASKRIKILAEPLERKPKKEKDKGDGKKKKKKKGGDDDEDD